MNHFSDYFSNVPLASKSLNVNICTTVCKQPTAAKGNVSAVWQAGVRTEGKKFYKSCFAICVSSADLCISCSFLCFVRDYTFVPNTDLNIWHISESNSNIFETMLILTSVCSYCLTGIDRLSAQFGS